MLDIFSVEDPRIRSVFLNSAIERRFLTLPPELPDGTRHIESQGELLRKHREHGIDMGARALQSCLKEADASRPTCFMQRSMAFDAREENMALQTAQWRPAGPGGALKTRSEPRVSRSPHSW